MRPVVLDTFFTVFFNQLQMNQLIAKAFNEQGNHERLAAASYDAIAYWCDAEDYSGFATFFFKQGEEEREHAQAFFQHLLDRGVQPKLEALDAPQSDFKNITEVALLAQTLEADNTAKIKLCYEISLETKDYESQPMLLKFIDEQVEEEAWTSKLVTLAKRAECPGALYNLDRHISKELES